jgi:hypothetical protein
VAAPGHWSGGGGAVSQARPLRLDQGACNDPAMPVLHLYCAVQRLCCSHCRVHASPVLLCAGLAWPQSLASPGFRYQRIASLAPVDVLKAGVNGSRRVQELAKTFSRRQVQAPNGICQLGLHASDMPRRLIEITCKGRRQGWLGPLFSTLCRRRWRCCTAELRCHTDTQPTVV